MEFNKESFLEGKILLIYKPLNWTSFQVVNKIRWLIKTTFNIKKIKVGHAGTLDPLADGLLIICTGKMTKKIDQFQKLNKTYTGKFFLGATTPSYDLETEVNSKKSIDHITEKLILKTIESFKGKTIQTPPIYSAIKHKGKKLYEFARKGETVKIKEREILISEFLITKKQLPELDFIVNCSKGTYIRSLANDFGRKLECGAYLKKLTRTAIGDHLLKNSISIEDFEKTLS
ncbi:tRNA pseudouridine(55) synthase TruB [Flavobacteriaceae bacterium]|nr:tRNA pseudouridine(55) synthase TruB [Flavobacteriaceae bacterium]|tara:strand:- start:779 stop:1471 length:693 start_codon:yes stop_codon:yes gene_type:complete